MPGAGGGAGGALGCPAQASPRPGRAEEQLHPYSPRPWSSCSCNDLGSHEFESQGEMPNFRSGLPLPALCSRPDLLGFSVFSVPSARVSVISVFVFGCLAVSPSSPILLPREEAPEVACPLLSHTHTHTHTHTLSLPLSLSLSLSPLLFLVCKLSSGVQQRQQQEKPAPAHPLPPPPLPCSPFTNQAPPSSRKALLPCRTQTSAGALMSPPCGPPAPGVPEPLEEPPPAPCPPWPSPEPQGP